MTRSVCIAASTLPIAFLAENSERLGVERVITTSGNLNRSYQYLAGKIGREPADRSARMQNAPNFLQRSPSGETQGA